MKRIGIILVLAVLLSSLGALPVGASTVQPGASPAVAPAAGSFVYVVVPGDTLARIAYRFGTNIWAIMRLNPAIVNPNRIYAGQRLLIPTRSTPTFTKVKVALIALDTGGTVGCGDSVVMVERQVAATTAPLTAAIRQLLSIKEQHYGQSGLYNALYQSNLTVQNVTLVNGKATIRLTGTVRSGGVCDDPRIFAQFTQTALQYSTVKSVEVLVNGVPLQRLLSEVGD